MTETELINSFYSELFFGAPEIEKDEAADPVEDQFFDIDGFKMSNFVTPAWFEPHPLIGHTKFDELGNLSAPFTLSKGGYIPIFKNGKVSYIWGSSEKETAFKLEDRRGHRTEFRQATFTTTSET